MKPFLYLMSIFWIIMGALAVIAPSKLKTFYTKLIKPLKAFFILPLVIGALLLWAQPASQLSAFIMIIGVLAILKGMFILIFPTNLIRSWVNYFLNRSDRWWRGYGICLILLGAIVWWSVW